MLVKRAEMAALEKQQQQQQQKPASRPPRCHRAQRLRGHVVRRTRPNISGRG